MGIPNWLSDPDSHLLVNPCCRPAARCGLRASHLTRTRSLHFLVRAGRAGGAGRVGRIGGIGAGFESEAGGTVRA